LAPYQRQVQQPLQLKRADVAARRPIAIGGPRPAYPLHSVPRIFDLKKEGREKR
jgi:hypothetical protein